MLVAQKSAAKDEPAPEDLYAIGSIANILQMLKLPDGTVKVLVEGSQRARINEVIDVKTHFAVDGRRRSPADNDADHEIEAMRRTMVQQFDQYVKLNKKIPPEILTSLAGIDEAGPARRHDRRAPAAQARAEAGSARDVRRQAAPRAPAEAGRGRARHPAGREAHPRARQAPDGEEPARVLPERAGEGDPERARRDGRGRRSRRDREAHQDRAHAQGSAQESRSRAEEAAADVADVGRSDGRAQLHRRAGVAAVAQEEQDQHRSDRTPRRSSTKTTTAWRRSRSASSSTSRCSSAWTR